MDLLRAAFLLESELPTLPGLPAWKRRELERIAGLSIQAMRDAATRIEQLEMERRSTSSSSQVRTLSHAQR